MKVLFYDWGSLVDDDMIISLKNMGHEISLLNTPIEDLNHDRNFKIELNKVLSKTSYDLIFSFNYFPVISEVCNENKYDVKYVCWVFDSPHLTLYSKTIKNACNYIFHFDGRECMLLETMGVRHIYHLPLAVNIERLDKIRCNDEECNKYKGKVSFVGSLYDNKNFYDQINYLPDYLKGYLEGIMAVQKNIYGYNFIEEMLTDTIMSQVKKYVACELGSEYIECSRFIFANLFLGQKITANERVEALEMLSDITEVNLYSNADPKKYPKLIHKGYIDYEEGMPKVFKQSEINLNISLRTIQQGIPLRVFDIMGAGGFVITNYQPEINDLFVPGEDLVVYESMEDLYNKVCYYLEHPEERERIARNGYEKVKEHHTFKNRIQKMMEIIQKQ